MPQAGGVLLARVCCHVWIPLMSPTFAPNTQKAASSHPIKFQSFKCSNQQPAPIEDPTQAMRWAYLSRRRGPLCSSPSANIAGRKLAGRAGSHSVGRKLDGSIRCPLARPRSSTEITSDSLRATTGPSRAGSLSLGGSLLSELYAIKLRAARDVCCRASSSSSSVLPLVSFRLVSSSRAPRKPLVSH